MLGSGLLDTAPICLGDYELWNIMVCICLSHCADWKEQGLMSGEGIREYG